MCGIAGIVDLKQAGRVDPEVLERMSRTLYHRGPNSSGSFVEGNVGLSIRRLSIIDIEGGDQPMFNEDRSMVLVCNGEIFQYQDIRRGLMARGHDLATSCDVEVLLHLFEERGPAMLETLNGQFAIALYDRREKSLLLARDHFGINPLYYGVFDDFFLFGSEIKAILAHPAVRREVDLTGLDQVLTLPGLVSPRTLFKGISSLKSGCFISLQEGGRPAVQEFWDLIYPEASDIDQSRSESYYVERLRELLFDAVRHRLVADVPVGFYLSGGLDSSLVAAAIRALFPEQQRHAFSIDFVDRYMSEGEDQKRVAQYTNALRHSVLFDRDETAKRLSGVIYHCECPIKESYNTCTLSLSEEARRKRVPVILTGEGADELFAGYVGYRFDQLGHQRGAQGSDVESQLEDELRERIWGDVSTFYELDYYAYNHIKRSLYSEALAERFDEFDCLSFELVNKSRLKGRHLQHRRSYLDFRLRLSDHLLGDHGDRMALANSVEVRHPFLDLHLSDFSRHIPPDLKVNGFQEKYVLRRVAEGLVPESILKREKFGWFSSGSPELLQGEVGWVRDMLSTDRIRRLGYFDHRAIEFLLGRYTQPGFKINSPFESDLLMVVLTFSLLVEKFELPAYS